MSSDIRAGDIVYLTKAYDEFVRAKNPYLPTILTNKLAKVEEIIDWGTEKGRTIKEARLKSGKWKGLNQDDCRYMLSVYHPDMPGRNGQPGVVERGSPMFERHPETGEPFFIRVPGWYHEELMRQCLNFDVKKKNVS